jgi:cytoskeletal protein RodZ
MKISKKPSRLSKKFLIGLAAIILLAAIFTYIFAFQRHIFDGNKTPNNDSEKSSIDYGPATDEQKEDGENVKPTPQDDSQNQNNNSGSNKQTVNITITAAEQNGAMLQIRSLIGTVTNSGTCTLALSKDSATVTKTAVLQPLANASTCKGFDVPVSELSSGAWKVMLSFENDQSIGTASGTAEIK